MDLRRARAGLRPLRHYRARVSSSSLPVLSELTPVWRNKETSRAEDELLIFPSEASFERVSADPTGRSFALKFTSSNQVHFVSLQREAACTHGLLIILTQSCLPRNC